MELKVEYLIEQEKHWPESGCHILAHYDHQSVVVYQAFKPSIAQNAVEHQKFGGTDYSFNRMSWIKPSFLWMMFRSGWATKVHQEHILAIHITISGFEWLLKNAYTTKRQKHESLANPDISVRLQWDPDHNVFGEKIARRAIQLGLRDIALHKFNEEFILKIEDITDFVKDQHEYILKKESLELLKIPLERLYVPADVATIDLIGLD